MMIDFIHLDCLCACCSWLLNVCLCFSGDSGKLLWTGNWVVFLDTMLQMIVLGLSGKGLRLPTRIRSVCINPVAHLEKVCEYADGMQGLFLHILLFNHTTLMNPIVPP